MNSLFFNPHPHTVTEWAPLYLSHREIDSFEAIIDRSFNYQEVIKINKLKRGASLNQSLDGDVGLPPVKIKRKLKRKISIRDEGGIEKFIE
jgi:hypothetical protein